MCRISFIFRAVEDESSKTAERLGKLYSPHALAILRAAPPDGRLTDAVEQLMPTRVAFPSRLVQSVNTPEELAEAERMLAAA